MPRPRTLDPLGTSDHPVVVTDPVREKALVAEFQRRLAFIKVNFQMGRMLVPGGAGFNQSLNRLKRAVHRSGPNLPLRRLHPHLELLISHKVRQYAAARMGEGIPCVSDEDIRRASQEVALQVDPRRGAPKDEMLRHHVWGLMALFQEATGKPVLAIRYTRDDYSPQPANALAEHIILVLQQCDPAVRPDRIVRLILEARRTYAGRAMRFSEFFPLYGATFDAETGSSSIGIGGRLESVEWAMPIYCP